MEALIAFFIHQKHWWDMHQLCIKYVLTERDPPEPKKWKSDDKVEQTEAAKAAARAQKDRRGRLLTKYVTQREIVRLLDGNIKYRWGQMTEAFDQNTLDRMQTAFAKYNEIIDQLRRSSDLENIQALVRSMNDQYEKNTDMVKQIEVIRNFQAIDQNIVESDKILKERYEETVQKCMLAMSIREEYAGQISKLIKSKKTDTQRLNTLLTSQPKLHIALVVCKILRQYIDNRQRPDKMRFDNIYRLAIVICSNYIYTRASVDKDEIKKVSARVLDIPVPNPVPSEEGEAVNKDLYDSMLTNILNKAFNLSYGNLTRIQEVWDENDVTKDKDVTRKYKPRGQRKEK